MKQQFSIEQWKPIVDERIAEEEKYEISSLGKLRSLKTKNNGKIIKPSEIRAYPILNIKLKSGKRTTRYIHKLIAEAFLEKENEEQTYVIHLDYNKANNQTRNLKWVNKKDMFAHQANNPNNLKGVIRNSKLTETDVMRLKMKLKRSKNPLYKIAKEFGITHTQLNRIRKGENWGHVKID